MSWYDYYYSPYENRIDQLSVARVKFCGLNTREVKLLLNKLADDDEIAEAYRYALEAEDCNIKAKQYGRTYSQEYYSQKDYYIKELARLCQSNGWEYGRQTSDVINIPWVVYFELPDCKQISFHTKSNVSYMRCKKVNQN